MIRPPPPFFSTFLLPIIFFTQIFLVVGSLAHQLFNNRLDVHHENIHDASVVTTLAIDYISISYYHHHSERYRVGIDEKYCFSRTDFDDDDDADV